MTRHNQVPQGARTPDAFSPPQSPVTPGNRGANGVIFTDGEHPTRTSSSQQRPRADTLGHQWNANSFIDSNSEASTGIPTPASSGVSNRTAEHSTRNAEDLLRRLSLVQKPDPTPEDPRITHPNLHLSGRIISATFCIPYTISKTANQEDTWDLTPRHGTSALYDSFSYLSSGETPWDHTLVGWTGEIRQHIPSTSRSPSAPTTPIAPRNKASAPIPFNGRSYAEPGQHDGLVIDKPDRKVLENTLKRDHCGEIVPVWLFDAIADNGGLAVLKDQQKWRRYGEHELYTLFHYKQNEPTDGRATKRAWNDYNCLNEAFADTILQTYRPGDVVVVHDYQLLLLPRLLRARVPGIKIGLFVHVPFPSYEYFRCLSHRDEVLEGMLGADMIGFQTHSYAQHFKSCCQRILHLDASNTSIETIGRHVELEVFPIGINVQATQVAAFGDPAVEEKITALKEQHADEKIIVGRDRLDSVRGVAQKLQAFEVFLERHPEWHDKVVLLQVTSPTTGMDKEKGNDKTANEISNLVSRINGAFGSLRWSPVVHFPQYLLKEEYFALLRIADVGLITTVRDGMNTTSLEYVLCQKENHGPLVLSEFSGTAGSLTMAMRINPWDLGGTASEINRALTMSAEKKKEMHDRLYKHVKTNSVQAWSDKFMRRLLVNLEANDQTTGTPKLSTKEVVKRYGTAKKRLFMFDYDGTLTPIVKDPKAAIPTERLISTLKTLAADSRNAVWIISGRDQAFLEEFLGHIRQLGLSAEHGSFMRYPNDDHWENLSEKEDMSWRGKVLEVFSYYESKTPGSNTEIKKIALTWHYRRADPDLGRYQAMQCKIDLDNDVASKWDVEVMPGKANLEVRPKFVNKGEIAKRLVEAYGEDVESAPEFVLCLGDDVTDEDMFKSLRNSRLPFESVFTVTIGPSSKRTLAGWHLSEPADVIATVEKLNESSK